MNRGQFTRISAAAHASGFDLQILPDPVLGKPVAHYMGVPLLVSDFITDTETTTKTSIYLVYLGRREGEPQFGGLVWFYNGDTGPGIRVDGPMRTSGTTHDPTPSRARSPTVTPPANDAPTATWANGPTYTS